MDKKIEALIKTEGDQASFDYRGIECEIRRHPSLGHLCGYIHLPADSPLVGMDTDEIEASYQFPAHGGLTWSRYRIEDGTQVIGFDCAHVGDLSPYSLYLAGEYRDMKYVTRCLMLMVDYYLDEVVPNAIK